MKPFLTSTDYTLWILGLVLELLILAFGIWRKHYRRHPAFLAYIAVCALKTVILMAVTATAPQNMLLYFVVYWTGSGLKAGALLAVELEIFTDIFKFYSAVPVSTVRSLIWMVSGILILGLATAVFYPANYAQDFYRFFETLSRTISIIALLLTFAVILQSERIGIPKTVTNYGICCGFFFWLASDILTSSVGWIYPVAQKSYLRPLGMGSFVIAEFVWLRFIARKLPEVSPISKHDALVVMRILDDFSSSNTISNIS